MALSLVLVAMIVAGAVVWLGRRPDARPLVITTPIPSPTREVSYKVYVSGAVAAPGVYEVRDGQRVEDALQMAGGALPGAELAHLNLAAKVRDEQQIHVPRQGEQPPAAPTAAKGGKVNLNTATLAELDTLPGIGPVTAEKILSYRRANGAFRRIEELLEAKLVNQRTFEGIKDLVSVGP
jgi:competence protein ComEA